MSEVQQRVTYLTGPPRGFEGVRAGAVLLQKLAAMKVTSGSVPDYGTRALETILADGTRVRAVYGPSVRSVFIWEPPVPEGSTVTTENPPQLTGKGGFNCGIQCHPWRPENIGAEGTYWRVFPVDNTNMPGSDRGGFEIFGSRFAYTAVVTYVDKTPAKPDGDVFRAPFYLYFRPTPEMLRRLDRDERDLWQEPSMKLVLRDPPRDIAAAVPSVNLRVGAYSIPTKI